MEWNVFYHDINAKKIRILNIFDHYGFNKDVQRNLKQIKNKDEFVENLRRDLSYYFRSKAKYEVIVTTWVGGRGTEDIKVDIYTQVMNNWNIFADYVWNSNNKGK